MFYLSYVFLPFFSSVFMCVMNIEMHLSGSLTSNEIWEKILNLIICQKTLRQTPFETHHILIRRQASVDEMGS